MSLIKQPKVGIFAGTFDPVHSGHLSFALHARKTAGLDEVCFVPERQPRHKSGATHFGHRVAMLRQAIKPYDDFSLLELVDKQFTVRRTLPQLKQVYGGSRLVLILGSDTFHDVRHWPHVSDLIKDVEFVVGIRSQHDLASVLQAAQRMKTPLNMITVVESVQPNISSSQIRKALRLSVPIHGLLPSVEQYARREWLYARIPLLSQAKDLPQG